MGCFFSTPRVHSESPEQIKNVGNVNGKEVESSKVGIEAAETQVDVETDDNEHGWAGRGSGPLHGILFSRPPDANPVSNFSKGVQFLPEKVGAEDGPVQELTFPKTSRMKMPGNLANANRVTPEMESANWLAPQRTSPPPKFTNPETMPASSITNSAKAYLPVKQLRENYLRKSRNDVVQSGPFAERMPKDSTPDPAFGDVERKADVLLDTISEEACNQEPICAGGPSLTPVLEEILDDVSNDGGLSNVNGNNDNCNQEYEGLREEIESDNRGKEDMTVAMATNSVGGDPSERVSRLSTGSPEEAEAGVVDSMYGADGRDGEVVDISGVEQGGNECKSQNPEENLCLGNATTCLSGFDCQSLPIARGVTDPERERKYEEPGQFSSLLDRCEWEEKMGNSQTDLRFEIKGEDEEEREKRNNGEDNVRKDEDEIGGGGRGGGGEVNETEWQKVEPKNDEDRPEPLVADERSSVGEKIENGDVPLSEIRSDRVSANRNAANEGSGDGCHAFFGEDPHDNSIEAEALIGGRGKVRMDYEDLRVLSEALVEETITQAVLFLSNPSLN